MRKSIDSDSEGKWREVEGSGGSEFYYGNKWIELRLRGGLKEFGYWNNIKSAKRKQGKAFFNKLSLSLPKKNSWRKVLKNTWLTWTFTCQGNANWRWIGNKAPLFQFCFRFQSYFQSFLHFQFRYQFNFNQNSLHHLYSIKVFFEPPFEVLELPVILFLWPRHPIQDF